MIMATKKPAFQKQTPVKPSLSENLKKKWWAVLLLGVFIFAVGSFAYNKYLDYKNVQDMKTLLSDFQQLEEDMEEETGEKLSIIPDCGYGGEKFNQSYSCALFILPFGFKLEDENKPVSNKYTESFLALTSSKESCSISKGGFYEKYGYCNFGTVRKSAEDRINYLIANNTECLSISCKMLK